MKMQEVSEHAAKSVIQAGIGGVFGGAILYWLLFCFLNPLVTAHIKFLDETVENQCEIVKSVDSIDRTLSTGHVTNSRVSKSNCIRLTEVCAKAGK